ncbi:MAG: YceI family protein [Bacteroidetes bacterium]|nr:YceI family protein [Bacteroidota bacterium]
MNNRFFTTLLILCLATSITAQGKYKTKTANITFEASVPSFQEVKGTNENVSAILNTETGEFASLALVTGFRFKMALMEEHFNENYMESSVFPTAIFKGKLGGFSMSDVSEEISEYTLKGSMTIHGVTQPLEVQVQVKKVINVIELVTGFILKPEQFNIKIPKIVSNNIAEEVFVLAMYSLSN